MKRRTAELVVASHRASDLANKLLALERARARGVASTAVDLAALLTRLRETHQGAADTRHVTLTVGAAPEGLSVTGDATMLGEALSNLIDNALRHGGPSLSRVTVTAVRAPSTLILTVEDNGTGIPPADIARATDRFVQVTPSEGSGLGLAIAEATARQHGGRIRITSADPGLRVALVLPLAGAAPT